MCRIEWLPLYAKDWADYAFSPQRQQRMLKLTQTARMYGIHAGADAAIALQQQHAFPLVKSVVNLSEARESIQKRMSWLAAAGFDFLSTETASVNSLIQR